MCVERGGAAGKRGREGDADKGPGECQRGGDADLEDVVDEEAHVLREAAAAIKAKTHAAVAVVPMGDAPDIVSLLVCNRPNGGSFSTEGGAHEDVINSI